MSALTAARSDVRGSLRRAADALPDAPIGTVPILWANAAAADARHVADATTVLDEIARTGYEGTQLGDDFPVGDALLHELAKRELRLAEVYVPIPATVDGPGPDAMAIALERLRLLDEADGDVLCMAVDGSDDRDRWAGRADSSEAPVFTAAAWDALTGLLHDVADAASALGHAMVFHPHAATFVEMPAEVDRLLKMTDPERVGLCLDTGHHIVGGGDPVAIIGALGERIRHVHLKDVEPTALARMQAGDYATLGDAVRDGLFTELGAGTLDLDGVLAQLAARDYRGWLMVEQDFCMGPPSESAAIGRRVLAASLHRLGRTGVTEATG